MQVAQIGGEFENLEVQNKLRREDFPNSTDYDLLFKNFEKWMVNRIEEIKEKQGIQKKDNFDVKNVTMPIITNNAGEKFVLIPYQNVKLQDNTIFQLETQLGDGRTWYVYFKQIFSVDELEQVKDRWVLEIPKRLGIISIDPEKGTFKDLDFNMFLNSLETERLEIFYKNKRQKDNTELLETESMDIDLEEKKNLELNLSLANDQLIESQRQSEQRRTDIINLNSEIEEKTEEINSLTDKINYLNEQIDLITNQKNNLGEQLNLASQNKDKSYLEAQIVKLKNELKASQKTLAANSVNPNQINRENEATINDLKKKLKEAEDLVQIWERIKIPEYLAKMNKKNEAIKRLNQEISTLNETLKPLQENEKDVQSQLEQLKQDLELRNEQEKNKNLKEEITRLNEVIKVQEQTPETQQLIEKVAARTSEIQQKNQALLDQSQETMGGVGNISNQQLTGLKNVNNDLNNLLNDMKSELASIQQGQFQSLKKSKEKSDEKIGELEGIINQKESKNAEINENLTTVQDNIAEKEKENKKLEETNKQLTARITALENEKKPLSENQAPDLSKKDEEISRLTNEKAKLEANQNQNKKTIEDLQNQLRRIKREDSMEIENPTLNQQLVDARLEYDTQINKKQQELVAVRVQIQEIQNMLVQRDNDIGFLKEENANLKQQIESTSNMEISKENPNLKMIAQDDQIKRLEDKLRSVNEQLKIKNKELDQVKKELKQANAQILNLKLVNQQQQLSIQNLQKDIKKMAEMEKKLEKQAEIYKKKYDEKVQELLKEKEKRIIAEFSEKGKQTPKTIVDNEQALLYLAGLPKMMNSPIAVSDYNKILQAYDKLVERNSQTRVRLQNLLQKQSDSIENLLDYDGMEDLRIKNDTDTDKLVSSVFQGVLNDLKLKSDKEKYSLENLENKIKSILAN